jgi:outer membrane biosynthesis protein TonB
VSAQTSPFMGPGAQYSALLHLCILMFLIFGMPILWKMDDDLQPSVMVMEILPITDKTNVPTAKPKPAAKQEKPKPEPEKPKEEPKPEPKPEPKEEPKPEQVEAEKVPEKPKEEPEPEPVKETPKEKPKETPKDDSKDFEEVLKDLTAKEDTAPAETPQEKEEAKAVGDAPYDNSLPMSVSEIDAIRSQIWKNWNVLAGARDGHELKVELVIRLQTDGTVLQVDVEDEGRYQSDAFFRAAADRAIRAVWKSSPLMNLPPDKYEKWKELKLNFDPREMLY